MVFLLFLFLIVFNYTYVLVCLCLDFQIMNSLSMCFNFSTLRTMLSLGLGVWTHMCLFRVLCCEYCVFIFVSKIFKSLKHFVKILCFWSCLLVYTNRNMSCYALKSKFWLVCMPSKLLHHYKYACSVPMLGCWDKWILDFLFLGELWRLPVWDIEP